MLLCFKRYQLRSERAQHWRYVLMMTMQNYMTYFVGERETAECFRHISAQPDEIFAFIGIDKAVGAFGVIGGVGGLSNVSGASSPLDPAGPRQFRTGIRLEF